jgi:uncharacterized protein DUF4136
MTTAGRRIGTCVLAVLTLLLVACSQFHVRSKQDPGADFGRLRTYAWLPPEQAEPADQRVQDRAVDRRIRTATENQLRAKGYRPADSAPADFLLNYRVSTSPDDALYATHAGYSGALWQEWLGASTVYDSYDRGTLYLAALDGSTKHMIWVGAASARLLPQVSLQKRMERVDEAIEQILAPFPHQ